jgi:membrane-associated phospholipid phosphatase
MASKGSIPLLSTAAANPSDTPPDAPVAQRGATPHSILIAVFWAIAIAVAFTLDRSLAVRLRDTGIAAAIKNAGHLKEAAKAPGYAWFPLVLAVALLIWHPLRWRAALFLILCAIVAGTNAIVKWLVGRFRPFKLPPFDLPQPFRLSPFNRGIAGLFRQTSDLSFVSGHTTLAFATAAGLAILFHKSRPIVYFVYLIAVIVLLERVGENAHWLSDAVCGAALGIFGVKLLAKCCGNLLQSVNS